MPVYLRKPIATCDFPGGVRIHCPPPLGPDHAPSHFIRIKNGVLEGKCCVAYMYEYIRYPLELTRQDNPKCNKWCQNRIEPAHDSLVHYTTDALF